MEYSRAWRDEVLSRDGIQVRVGIVGSTRYLKASWPVRYGLYHEIRTPSYVFQFSPEGVIRFIQGRPGTWHDHADWFKRTAGGDWVYYSSGGYNGAYSAIGEHYIPIFPYSTNNVIGETDYPEGKLRQALAALDEVVAWAGRVAKDAPSDEAAFLGRVCRKNREGRLDSLAARFHGVSEGPLSVLPPDSRHVDYDILPICLAQGCLYHCRFCGVKSPLPFTVENEAQVVSQVAAMGGFFKRDLVNLGGVFLGGHDALAAGAEKVVAAARACESLFAGEETMAGPPSLFLFGSPDAVLGVTDDGWDALDRLPFRVWINTGVESMDSETLRLLGRPTPLSQVEETVRRADEVVRRCRGVSISLNLVTGEPLPPSHHEALARFVASREPQNAPLYLSPLKGQASRRSTRAQFTALKRSSRAPIFLYLLQRL